MSEKLFVTDVFVSLDRNLLTFAVVGHRDEILERVQTAKTEGPDTNLSLTLTVVDHEGGNPKLITIDPWGVGIVGDSRELDVATSSPFPNHVPGRAEL